MSDRETSGLMNECEEPGMTNAQYKGMLIDQRRSWMRVLELASA